jgi:hypothetical protein
MMARAVIKRPVQPRLEAERRLLRRRLRNLQDKPYRAAEAAKMARRLDELETTRR